MAASIPITFASRLNTGPDEPLEMSITIFRDACFFPPASATKFTYRSSPSTVGKLFCGIADGAEMPATSASTSFNPLS